MKKTPTLLMKELTYIGEEIIRLHSEDENNSFAPLNDDLSYKYKNDYDYDDIRTQLQELYKKELHIKSLLAKFNNETKADGTDLTVQEALVRIAQLRHEIKVLTKLANTKEYFDVKGDYYERTSITNRVLYDVRKANADLKAAQKELTTLQMAVDKTNLTTFIEC